MPPSRSPTLIGGAADHRFIAGPGELHAVVTALAASVLGSAAPADAPAWLGPVLSDLHAAGPRALVHAGPYLPAEAQALVHQINHRLGGQGTTFDLIEPVAARPPGDATGMAALLDDMRAGRVDTLLILDGNPAYSAKGFRDALGRVRFSLSTAPAPDETARLTTWFVPQAHVFEAWGDVRADDGTVSIQQPQALPLYDGRSAFEVLALFGESGPATGDRDRVRQSWRDHVDDAGWLDALANGVLPGTAFQPVRATPLPSRPVPAASPKRELNLLIRPDPSLGDGRHANNPWLQELPRPVSKLVWDNPLLVAPATARRLGLPNGDEVELGMGDASVLAPVWVTPGQAEDCVVGLARGRPHQRGRGRQWRRCGRDTAARHRRRPDHSERPGARCASPAPTTTTCWRSSGRRWTRWCATAPSPPSPPTRPSCASPARNPRSIAAEAGRAASPGA